MKFLIWLLPFLIFSCAQETQHTILTKIPKKKEKPPRKKIYGFYEDEYNIYRDTIKKNETFGEILNHHHLDYPAVYKLVDQIKDSFDIKRLKTGRPYLILSKKDSLDSIARPKVFIYENSPLNYTLIDFNKPDSIRVIKKERPLKKVKKSAKVVINKSLYQDLTDKNLSPKLAMELSNIYAWTVDFFHLNKGDEFKVIYEDIYIDDTVYAGIGKIHAALFKYGGKNFYAFQYPVDSTGNDFDYFDETGRTLRKQFLKAPLKFGRISSRYNMHRYIKLYGRVKPHLGTDFAAPVGTPIMATANGVVIKKGYTRGNGNYIKIKHNSTYSTQYLHMSKFAKGIHTGSEVKQGDIIGYVGMTGFTSGPHVCYRFWKNGKQVDALKEKMPPAKPIDSLLLPQYLQDIQNIKRELDSLN